MVQPTRLLIIEDNPSDAKLYHHMLSANERRVYHATVASRLGDGLRLLAERTFQIALLDLNLPDSRGLATLELLLNATSIPVVVLTGLEDELIAREALLLGAQDYLLKDKINAERLDNALSYAEIRYQAELAQREQARLQTLLEKEREINTLRSQFVSMISHDFRNPLTTIAVATNNLAAYYDRMQPTDRQRRFNQINEAVQYLASLTEDFVTISRIEDGRISVTLDDADLVGICQAIVERYETITEGTHHIVLEAQGSVWQVLDRNLTTRVITNLIGNAIKYSPVGTTVTVRLADEGLWSRIEVADEGHGIPTDECERVFTPFFRASNAQRSGIKGTGLGLAIVKHIVDLHQGRVEVESVLNQGTIFRVWLPKTLAITIDDEG